MKTQLIEISRLKLNQDNPRSIDNEKYSKLVKSLKEFPEMLKIRPVVINRDFVVLGGNMRLRACQEIGLEKIPVIIADGLTPEQQEEFIIKDNVPFGTWDWDLLANNWDTTKLAEWGLEVWQPDNINLDDYLESDESQPKEKDPIICPHCGKDIHDKGE